MNHPQMTLSAFRKLARERGLMNDTDTWHACKLVLCVGFSPAAAAHERGINQSNVSRALKKLKAAPKTCEHCGQRLPWGAA